MSYSITTSPDGKYVILKIQENITAENMIKMIVEAHAFGNSRNLSCYLVDATRCRNTSTVTDNYLFAYEDMKTTPGINLTARVAMLVSPDDHSHDFIETVTQNSGFDTQLFRDHSEAVLFLTRV
ncbi:hypothetical protein JW906_15280 [bacterium]|nr:hypothetical protein [bacterium]